MQVRHAHSRLCKLALALCCLGSAGCDQPTESARFETLHTPEALARQSEEFRQGIEEVRPGIWLAKGYGLANSILIEGNDGLIVIDTMETMEEGRKVAAAFRKLSTKPLRAILYTHNHADHVFGAQAFVDALADDPSRVEVIAHESLAHYVNRIVSEYRPIVTARSFRMFGTRLDQEAFVNNGLGPALGVNEQSTFGFITPTRTFQDHLQLQIAGVDLELFHAPGETNDALFVWLPTQKILAVGDNIYKAFPNLYTIRGTPYRPLKQWAASIDKMRALPAELLLPSHTSPLRGQAEIHRILTNYRDAIRYVHDQTVRWINAGLTPDEIVSRVQLPPHLAQEPYLQEFYGKVEWSVRSVFAGNLGWFDGNPASLHPLAPAQQAQHVADLAGGQDALETALKKAQKDGNLQWALQLTDWLLRLDREHPSAMQARIDVLTRLGEAESNPNARHYYLMSALELRDGIRLRPATSGSEDMLRALPMSVVMNALATNLNAEKALEMDRRIGIRFPDTGETWTLWVRRGVLEPVPRLLENLEMHVEVDSVIWKKMLGRQLNPAAVVARDMRFVQGGRVGFTRFLLLFKPAREAPEPAPLANHF